MSQTCLAGGLNPGRGALPLWLSGMSPRARHASRRADDTGQFQSSDPGRPGLRSTQPGPSWAGGVLTLSELGLGIPAVTLTHPTCRHWAWPRDWRAMWGRTLPASPLPLPTPESRSLTGPLADPPGGALHGPTIFLTSLASQRCPLSPLP